jgi:hypothetical protein
MEREFDECQSVGCEDVVWIREKKKMGGRGWWGWMKAEVRREEGGCCFHSYTLHSHSLSRTHTHSLALLSHTPLLGVEEGGGERRGGGAEGGGGRRRDAMNEREVDRGGVGRVGPLVRTAGEAYRRLG